MESCGKQNPLVLIVPIGLLLVILGVTAYAIFRPPPRKQPDPRSSATVTKQPDFAHMVHGISSGRRLTDEVRNLELFKAYLNERGFVEIGTRVAEDETLREVRVTYEGSYGGEAGFTIEASTVEPRGSRPNNTGDWKFNVYVYPPQSLDDGDRVYLALYLECLAWWQNRQHRLAHGSAIPAGGFVKSNDGALEVRNNSDRDIGWSVFGGKAVIGLNQVEVDAMTLHDWPIAVVWRFDDEEELRTSVVTPDHRPTEDTQPTFVIEFSPSQEWACRWTSAPD